MADIVDRATRSRMMSGIRAGNTKPELAVRSFLHRAGLRFRLHSRSLPGTPDVVLPRWRTVVFVHGCFWHRHPGCPKAYTPKSNKAFWMTKFRRNVARDEMAVRSLRKAGWRIFTLWECQVTPNKLKRLANAIRKISAESSE
jgi:DNA mismatch endonuclease (patch repair protein)